MAFPGGTSTTTASGVQTSMAKYYDALLISTLDPMTRFMQFGQRRPLPQGTGKVVVWNKAIALGHGYTLTEGAPVSTVKQLSTTNVSATIEAYGDTLNISDLVDLVGVFSARKVATERLAAQAAQTLDTVVMMTIIGKYGNTAGSDGVAHYIKGSTSAYYATSADVTATASDPRLQVSDVRRIAFRLRANNVPTFDGENYVAIAHPYAIEDIISDSNWVNAHIYTTPENVYRGEIGKIYGVRFVETTLAPISCGSANGIALSVAGVSTLAYGTAVFGKEFYGVTEIDGGIKTFLNDGPSKADPLDQVTILGWKAFFTSKILNADAGIVAWAGSGDTMTGASTASARKSAGMNVDDYPGTW